MRETIIDKLVLTETELKLFNEYPCFTKSVSYIVDRRMVPKETPYELVIDYNCEKIDNSIKITETMYKHFSNQHGYNFLVSKPVVRIYYQEYRG